jgi:formylmethanofuran dehydrogenase subunit E
MITLRKESRMRTHHRDCFECGDQHEVTSMYPKEGNLICEPCLQGR